MARVLSAATIFLSAFLLFLIQPLIAKIILPWFGGSAAVWAACLVFFQTALLLGYLYAHALSLSAARVQARVHASLLAVSAAALPFFLRASPPAPGGEPALKIVALLAAAIGLPFFTLSATSPLLQVWDAAREDSAAPFRLYAVSNAGSMLALLSYPFVVEPRLTLRAQAKCWAAAYVVFAAACAALALRARGRTAAAVAPASSRPPLSRRLLWLLLSACSSTLLLAATNHLCQNVAAIPFLWLLPLTLYLLSFIVVFAVPQWRWSRSFLAFPALAVGAMVYALSADIDALGLRAIVAIFSGGLFVGCLFCHGELARLKPAPEHLTLFYLLLSAGGALGGLFVGLAAPKVFPDFYELPLAVAGVGLLSWALLYRDGAERWWSPGWLCLGAAMVAVSARLAADARALRKDDLLTRRNFYGVLRLSESGEPGDPDDLRMLTHGAILHGEQFTAPAKRRRPTSYYGMESGVGLAVRQAQARGPVKLGVIGLGAGTMAAYGRAGDVVRFYEINPAVVAIARSSFTFLSDSPAQVQVALADARLSLASEPPQGFDVLVVDAFSSDAIPVHLLTQEALDLYLRHLKESGVLAVHVSNRYLDLEPVVSAAVAAMPGRRACAVRSPDDDDNALAAADWVLVSARASAFSTTWLKTACGKVRARQDLRRWTDDYSNLYQILK